MDLTDDLVEHFDGQVEYAVNVSRRSLSDVMQDILWFGMGSVIAMPMLATFVLSLWSVLFPALKPSPDMITAITASAATLGFFATMACPVMRDWKFAHPAVRTFLRKRRAERRAIRKDCIAFQKHIRKIGLVANRSPLYDELRRQCERRQQELLSRIWRFRSDLEQFQQDAEEQRGRREQAMRLAKEQKELQSLAKNLGSVVSIDPCNGITRDVASHVATLQALDAVKAEAQALLPPDPFHDRT